MKNRFAFIIGTLILGASVMAGAQVSEDIPGLEQGPGQAQGPAQPQGQEQAQAEPSSSVARISLMHGDVSTQRGDSGDWATAAVNQPMVSSDKISTGANSRAEVQLDSANILRLGDSTLASIAGLTRNQIQVQLERGLIDYSVFKGAEGEVEIDTANAAIRPAQNDGIYRIQINAEGETLVIVRKGSAEIATPQGSTQVEKGQMAIVRGTGDNTQYKLAEAPSNDSWDSWNNERNRLIYDAQSWGKTNRYYTGSEDLDTYGRWVTVPDYGPVWTPAVGPGWAPYRSGRWVWEPGWGWTWVSYEPWGWAPYHYGRWFVYNSSWVWWPGPAYGYPRYRPVWAPAYVSFFGFGGGVGVSVGFGFGSVGWLPIGPCDRFYPWYGRYGSRYNVGERHQRQHLQRPGAGIWRHCAAACGWCVFQLAPGCDERQGARRHLDRSDRPVRYGTFHSCRSQRRNLPQRTYDRGKPSRGSDAVGVVGNQPAGSGVHVAAWRRATALLLENTAGSCAAVVRPAGHADAAVAAAQRCGSGPVILERGELQPEFRRPADAGSSDSRPAAGSISSDAQQAERERMSGRPTTSNDSGWRRFSDTNSAQRNGGMNRPSGTVAGGRRPTMFRGRETRWAGALRPTTKAGGTSRHDPAETSRALLTG